VDAVEIGIADALDEVERAPARLFEKRLDPS
jgi:hypothetical protein